MKGFTLPQLKNLAKEHNIKNFSYMNKNEIKALLINKQIITGTDLNTPQGEVETKKTEKDRGEVNPKYEYLKTIRTNPKNRRSN